MHLRLYTFTLLEVQILQITTAKEESDAKLNEQKTEKKELQIQLTESTRKLEKMNVQYALEECDQALKGLQLKFYHSFSEKKNIISQIGHQVHILVSRDF